MNKKLRVVAFLYLTITASGCALKDIVEVEPVTQGAIVNPELIESYDGALGVYRAAVIGFHRLHRVVIGEVAKFTDEVTAHPVSETGAFTGGNIDTRRASNAGVESSIYGIAHTVNIAAQQAVDLLSTYSLYQADPKIGHAYAIRGYVALYLGEIFCSGIPLSRAEYGGKITYGRGLNTNEVFEYAISMFDSAQRFIGDSQSLNTLIKVGKGRALINIGRLSDAAGVVSSVVNGSVYEYSSYESDSALLVKWYYVKNNKGGNGLIWLSQDPAAQDPRIAVSTSIDSSTYNYPVLPIKFVVNEYNNYKVASDIEARLIEAEYQLSHNNGLSNEWVKALNDLRAVFIRNNGERILPDLINPPNWNERIALLFKERAYWLYLEGHRMGDLRRMSRQYNIPPLSLWPIGVSEADPSVPYGSEFVFAPDADEEQLNPEYTGCNHRNP